MKFLSLFFIVTTLIHLFSPAISYGDMNNAEINIMAPLLIGDTNQPGTATDQDWQNFRDQLVVLKKTGMHAISTDIWWGLVEGNAPGQYQWDYYKKMATVIQEVGLKWVPILSFHKLGGNVGDRGQQDIPEWVWSRHIKNPSVFKSPDDLKFKSEYGNLSNESISVWATDIILADLKRFMENFEIEFKYFAPIISEINISLGPAGELRYPSYNQHDKFDTYDSRGAIQAYSNPAILSFQKYVKQKYQTLEKLNQAWDYNLTSFSEVFPPNPNLLQYTFWNNQEQFSSYGKDFFDWYNFSLALHGRKILSLASSVFGRPQSSLKDVELGAKIPGIHWRMGSDRTAELAAGLIRTSYSDWNSSRSGFGYDGILSTFKPKIGNMNFVLHFTALEMDDGHDNKPTNKPKTLVHWIAQAAKARGLDLKGENALSWELGHQRSWDNLYEAITEYGYKGVTLLRINEILPWQDRMNHLKDFQERVDAYIPKSCSSIFQ